MRTTVQSHYVLSFLHLSPLFTRAEIQQLFLSSTSLHLVFSVHIVSCVQRFKKWRQAGKQAANQTLREMDGGKPGGIQSDVFDSLCFL